MTPLDHQTWSATPFDSLSLCHTLLGKEKDNAYIMGAYEIYMIHCLLIFVNSCAINPRSALKSLPFLDIKIALKVKTAQIKEMPQMRSGCFEQQNVSDEIVFSRIESIDIEILSFQEKII